MQHINENGLAVVAEKVYLRRWPGFMVLSLILEYDGVTNRMHQSQTAKDILTSWAKVEREGYLGLLPFHQYSMRNPPARSQDRKDVPTANPHFMPQGFRIHYNAATSYQGKGTISKIKTDPL
jgi:hypothetical protein